MRISLSKADLSRVLSAVVKIPESRTTIPILSNVLLSVEDGKLTVKATDLDIEASSSIPVLDAVPGSTTVEAKLLDSIVKKAGGDISLELIDGTLVVKSGRAKWSLQTLPASDYPDLNAGEFDVEFDVDLAALVAPVSFAMSTEATRYYLCGVFLQPGIVTATDGHRLSTNAADIGEGSWPDHKPVIIPSKAVGLLPKGVIKVALSETKIRFTTDDGTITSRLIDGTFPDYERVIPKQHENSVTVDGAALRAAADRVASVSTDRAPSVRIDISREEMTLSARGSGEALDVVSCEMEGPADDITIGFNSRYLVDVLGALPGGPVKIALQDGGSPAILTSDSAPGQRIVLMPHRVS